MTTRAPIAGTLYRAPERRTSKTGKPFVSAVIREGDGDAATWWKILCFNEAVADELIRLADGEGVAVSGSFKVETFEKNGEQRLSYTLFADAVLSARRPSRDRRAKAKPAQETPAAPTLALSGPDDDIPF
jgi:hypothetical protein